MAAFYGTPGAVPDILFAAAAAAVAWLLLAADALGRLIREPRAILAELRDPVLSPFWSLPWLVGMILAIGLEPHAHGAAKVAFLVFFVATLLFGGWITGEWDRILAGLHRTDLRPPVVRHDAPGRAGTDRDLRNRTRRAGRHRVL
jgi:hypothetical protein